MFQSPDVWMVFKAGKLATVEVDGVEHRMAECSLVIEPFRLDLAEQLGESVRVHLYDDDARLRSELATITLDPRVPKQMMSARGAEGVPATEIRLVEILAMTCARQADEKTGEEWIKATIRVRFDFAPKVHREWIAMYFGLGFHATFEAEQLDMLSEAPK